ncbi:MAG: hypothetical protein IPO37_20250 [Saprospiraceae bacterium]|nr:hypothetical protein [Saprospiraceae bacterium]
MEKKVTKAKEWTGYNLQMSVELKVETERCECGADLMAVKGEISEVRQVQDIPEHR